MRHCGRLTCCTTFGRTHRFWCSFVWLFTSGMRSVGGFRRFDVEQSKRRRHLRSRWAQSRKKPEAGSARCADQTPRRGVSTLTHSASDKDEVHHEHNREQVSEPADLARAIVESFHNRVAHESKRAR